MRLVTIIIIFLTPFLAFAEEQFDQAFFAKYVLPLRNNAEKCSALGWNNAGEFVFATTVEAEGSVGGYNIDLIVFNTVYDFTVASFRFKNTAESELNKKEMNEAIQYLKDKKIVPLYQTLQGFPLEYKNDFYSIEEYSLRERIKTYRILKLVAKNSRVSKPLDVSGRKDKVVGFYKSPYEHRIAICWYVPPMGGPHGTNMGGGYFMVSGCLMDVGFEKPTEDK